MTFEADTSELDRLLGDLGRASHRVFPEGARAVRKGAENIKKDWRRRWSGHPHFPALPDAVTYDVREFGHDIEAEIGPDKSLPQGPLGNIIEFGTSRNVPIPGGLAALSTETPNFERALVELAERLLS